MLIVLEQCRDIVPRWSIRLRECWDISIAGNVELLYQIRWDRWPWANLTHPWSQRRILQARASHPLAERPCCGNCLQWGLVRAQYHLFLAAQICSSFWSIFWAGPANFKLLQICGRWAYFLTVTQFQIMSPRLAALCVMYENKVYVSLVRLTT